MFSTNYHVAVHWLRNSYILCNDIVNVDPSVLDNMRFDSYNEDEDSYMEIYQWFLTSASEWDVEWLEKHFGLHFTYSELLDLYVLCVPHYGTGWDYVYWEADFPEAERELGEKK